MRQGLRLPKLALEPGEQCQWAANRREIAHLMKLGYVECAGEECDMGLVANDGSPLPLRAFKLPAVNRLSDAERSAAVEARKPVKKKVVTRKKAATTYAVDDGA